MNSNNQRFFDGAIRTVILSLFIGLSSTICGQNLVPNPSFEEYSVCPDAGNENIESALYWISPTAYSPDYYNSCATDSIFGQSVPNNGFGYQHAKTGNAYAGFISMIETNAREYIQVELSDTLIAGAQYDVKFYVSAADSSPYIANQIGAYFSVNSITNNDLLLLPFDPQIENSASENPLDNQLLWTEITGSFIAEGGEKYVTIGNFNSDINTDTTLFENGSQWLSFSYHYIDDVSVIEAFANSVDNDHGHKINVFPNPTSSSLNVQSTEIIQGLRISTITGQILIDMTPDEKNVQIDVSHFPTGIYCITTYSDTLKITKQFIINQ